MNVDNSNAFGEISYADAAVYIGILGHLQVIIDQDDPSVLRGLLRRLRLDFVRYGLAPTDTSSDLVAAIEAMVVWIRERALHEELPH